jgi:hypothetical protein
MIDVIETVWVKYATPLASQLAVLPSVATEEGQLGPCYVLKIGRSELIRLDSRKNGFRAAYEIWEDGNVKLEENTLTVANPGDPKQDFEFISRLVVENWLANIQSAKALHVVN